MKRSIAMMPICLLGISLAFAVPAQTRNSVNVQATAGSPEFRDPRTGRVWTPENVGRDGKPISPEDKAFDPSSQVVPTQSVTQSAVPKPVGTVPITAGPTVPIVEMDNLTLRVVPGQRWQLTMYINNNSGNPITPVLDCQFTNHGRPVTLTQVRVGQMGPGMRAGIAVMGPRAEFFVDQATCNLLSS